MQSPSLQQSVDATAAYGPWFYKNYQARFLPWHTQVYAIQKMQLSYPWAMMHCGTRGTADGMQAWMWSVKELNDTRKKYIEHVLHNPSFLRTMETNFNNAWERFLKLEQRYAVTESELPLEERINAFVTLSDAETDAAQHAYINDCFLTTGGVDWLLEWFDKEIPPTTPERKSIIEQLTVPILPSFVQEESVDILRIAAAPPQDHEQLLMEHTNTWHWVENSYIESEPLTLEQFKKKVDAQLELGNVNERLNGVLHATQEKRAQKKHWLEALNSSKELQCIVDMSDCISHMTDLRKMGVLRLNHWTWKLLHDIEQATVVPFSTLVWSRQLELPRAFSTGDWSVMHERKQTGNLTIISCGEFQTFTGEALRQLDVSRLIPSVDTTSSVHGQSAYPGVVEGIARIIRGRADFPLFNDGDVLITNQTTPEFVPLMKRACAVVTEQGGITCHAAIVSRELQMPCVIGTQTAMSAFTSGEMIIVDATRGVVRKRGE